MHIVVLLVVLLVASSCDLVARLVPCVEHRHASGIMIVCPDEIEPWKTASEELKGAVSFAYELAEANPDAFGYPTVDFAKNEVVLRIVRPQGEAIARGWMASGAEIVYPKATRSLPRPAVPVRFEPATRSFAQLEQIKHDVGPNLAALPDADAINGSGGDRMRNTARYTVDRESDALLHALAQRYGTDALVVQVDPNGRTFLLNSE